jgi:hypothetical protein
LVSTIDSRGQFQIPAMAEALSRVRVNNLQDLYIRYLGNKNMLDPLFNSYPIPPNSDFFPFLISMPYGTVL